MPDDLHQELQQETEFSYISLKWFKKLNDLVPALDRFLGCCKGKGNLLTVSLYSKYCEISTTILSTA